MALRWYVVHVYSGFENKVKAALAEVIKRKHEMQQVTNKRNELQQQIKAGLDAAQSAERSKAVAASPATAASASSGTRRGRARA